VTSRFSTLGAIAVTLIIASGLANAWYRNWRRASADRHRYGRLLLAKLAVRRDAALA
jgi:putative copper export protein